LRTPVRRLMGVTYWVIEDSEAIRDFINTEIRREWEADAVSEHRDPKDDYWLKTLSERKWSLKTMDIVRIKLDPDIMNYVDPEKGYVFSKSLAERSRELQESIEMGGLTIWPLVVRKEDMQLVDGYCRYAALKTMKVSRIYTYIGAL
jgi:hypothetical protein